MIGRNGLGPVFVYDMLALARRWQVYAARAAFVLFLLIGMTIAWSSSQRNGLISGGTPTLQQLAKIGENFFYALAGIQLSFILLAAPASAAGSICIDRARGTLLHMMVTDLSDAEIVLGRLGARLLPVFGFVACGVPVLALAGLLGGIVFEALMGLIVVSIALAILGCSMALAISVKASKTHEVLMAVYMAFGVWLLALPIWLGMARGTTFAIPPDWFQKLNPFLLVYAPYTKPGFVELIDFAIFFGIMLFVSTGLVAWSVWRLRRAVIEATGSPERARRRIVWLSKLWPTLPGPTLDGNPVLWREWHRNRPSRLARRLWIGLMVVTWGLGGYGIYEMCHDGITIQASALQLGFMLQLFFGLLIVAATSSTVLAEERTRGSLDILLSTPMSTHSIVMAKWWGAYRLVLTLSIMPVFVAVFLASATPDVPLLNVAFRWPTPPVPLSLTDRFLGAAFGIADFLISGALIVSIGLALATWISRIGRAVGTSVVVYFLLGIGWPILAETLVISFFSGPYRTHWVMQSISSLSPIFGSITPIQGLSGYAFESRDFLWQCLTCVILTKLLGMLTILGLTLGTFNRCLGRVVESRPEGWKLPAAEPKFKTSRNARYSTSSQKV